MRYLVLLQTEHFGGEGSAEGASEAANGAGEQATEGVQQTGCGGGGMGIEFLIWMVFLFGLMYFLLIRPQKKQRDRHAKLLAGIQRGDRIITTGGILGTVKGLEPQVVVLQVAENVVIRVRKEHVAGLQVEGLKDGGKAG